MAIVFYRLKIVEVSMDDVKPIYQSRTFWGVVVSFISTIAALWGHGVGAEAQAGLVDCGVAIGAAVGAVATVYGRMKASKKVSVKKGANGAAKPLLVLALCVPLSLQACALADLSPQDRALAVGEELRINYVGLYAEYGELHEALPPEGVAFLHANVAPAMDTAKRAIVAYRDAAQVYARTDTEPEGYDALLRDARRAFSSCAALIMDAKQYLDGGDKS
jgi:hypothetical protein